jgi:hypothetical protein
MLQLTPEILALAISIEPGIICLNRGEQHLAINRMETILNIAMTPESERLIRYGRRRPRRDHSHHAKSSVG